MPCWFLEDGSSPHTYLKLPVSNSRACHDPAPANWAIALLLQESSFPHQNSADPSTTGSGSLLGLQEVIALSLVYFSSSTLVNHSATTGGTSTNQCAGIFSIAPVLKYTIFEKEKMYWQPSPYLPLMLSYLRFMPLPPHNFCSEKWKWGS